MRKVSMAVVSAVLAVAVASPAGAAVLCQKKNRIKVRPDVCKGKETQIQDLGALDQRTGDAQRILEAQCAGDAERTLVIDTPSFLYAGDECTGGCRAFDGDQAGCEGSFQLTWSGATGCVYLDGRCYPCKECGERAGRCIDACEPVACEDRARTVFKGGPGTEACRGLATQEACEAAWALQSGRQPVSCYWDGVAGECFGCGESNERDGNCVNACRAPNECADPGRAWVSYCGMLDGDETGCNGAYTKGGGGRFAYTCWYHTGSGECRDCRPVQELLGNCADTCDDWP